MAEFKMKDFDLTGKVAWITGASYGIGFAIAKAYAAAGAKIVGTGRSDFPNQINNVVAFPGIFRGALDVRASAITENMKIAAAYAIASLVDDDKLNEDYILPYAFDERIKDTVANAVAEAARKDGVARI